jgi:precorrin-6Y C5,15-methyltransferase (decarboxylating)
MASGDPGLFSIRETLKARLPDIPMRIIPGIGSVQYLASRMNIDISHLTYVSLHGREDSDLLSAVRHGKTTAVFCGNTTGPAAICAILEDAGLSDVNITVGGRLSLPGEDITVGKPRELASQDFAVPCVMIVENGTPVPAGEQSVVPGIPDEAFIRERVPMTKREVRAVVLSLLAPGSRDITLDIGAGTGSVSIECARLSPNGIVYAVEHRPEAQELIRRNAQLFGTSNIRVVSGTAPDVLAGLPEPNRVFIGGTGNHTQDIIETICSYRRSSRIVLTAVTVETAGDALRSLQQCHCDNVNIIQLAVSRGTVVGEKHLMTAQNPVYIISADKNSRPDDDYPERN